MLSVLCVSLEFLVMKLLLFFLCDTPGRDSECGHEETGDYGVIRTMVTLLTLPSASLPLAFPQEKMTVSLFLTVLTWGPEWELLCCHSCSRSSPRPPPRSVMSTILVPAV